MSSSLSTMPFSRQYGSFRLTTTTGNTATGTGPCSPATNGNHRISHASRHSSGTDASGGQVSTAARLQIAPLSYRVGNLARNVSNNWISNSNTTTNTNTTTTTFAAIRQQKISSNQQEQQGLGRPGTTAAGGKQVQPPPPPPQLLTDRCAVHRAAGLTVPATRKMGEPIGDSPLLQSPRIIARSARIVEPNAWNRRLTTSSFCTVQGTATSQQHQQMPSNRFLQTPLACRKSPGSSGTSVESIVPKYTRAGNGGSVAGVEPTTAAQKRTYNAHKPQLRVVSCRAHTNTTGRVGTVAKKATGPGTTPVGGTHSTHDTAEREVAKVLHHHNMRVIDLLNNNHLQQGNRGGRVIKENNENHQPLVSLNGGQKHQTGGKKGSAIPQRLPLADREQPAERNRRLMVGGGGSECFSSKFPNGLPFEQEFYYRRTGQDTDPSAQTLHEADQDVEQEEEEEEEEMNVHNHLIVNDAYHQRIRKTKKHALLPGRRQTGQPSGVTLAGRRVAMTHQDLVPHRSRSVSSSDGTMHGEERRSVSAIEREHDDEDALYVDFTKVHDPQAMEQQQQQHEAEDDSLQTSVVEYRNINHSSYYYKFESISAHRKEPVQRKLIQRRADATNERQELRSRYQRSRLGLNRTGTGKPDVNGNGGREYYDDDDEIEQNGGEDEEEEDEEEEEEGEGERSTVYVAVATWVPKCNRLPNESNENNNSICLTLATNGNGGEDIDQQQQQHQQQQRPTRIAVAANNTATAAVPPTNRKALPIPAPARYGQL
uniref:Uncharacterized protein n=1 Tax=Anopheles christyi TaxID=43041 RepID=A0A182KG65_9DIPT